MPSSALQAAEAEPTFHVKPWAALNDSQNLHQLETFNKTRCTTFLYLNRKLNFVIQPFQYHSGTELKFNLWSLQLWSEL